MRPSIIPSFSHIPIPFQRSRRGGGASMRRPVARPAAAPRTSVPARSASSVPAPQQSSSGGGMLSGIGSTIAQGMAFGTGSAIAHRAVGAAAGALSGGGGGASHTAEAPEYAAQGSMMSSSNNVCSQDKEMFYECLQHNKGDQDACKFLYEQLKQCQMGQSQMSFN